MTHWLRPPELQRSHKQDRFDPVVEGARLGLAREVSLAIWDHVRAGATQHPGRAESEAVQQFRELAARTVRRGGRFLPEVGRRTRVEAESSATGRGGKRNALPSRVPGRDTLVAQQARSRSVPDEPAEGHGDAAHRSGPPGSGEVLRAMTALLQPEQAKPAGLIDHARRAEHEKIGTAVRALGTGTPLRSQVERDYSARLGVDLGSVRLHLASSAPGELGALAFVHGTDIAIAPEVDIESPGGEHVLAHELVHVAQNLRAGAPMQLAAYLEVGPSDSPIEQEAEAGADALTAGQSFRVASRAQLPGISLRGGPVPAKHSPPRHKNEPAESMDQLVRNELETRADPARKAAYDKACAQIDILRIQALQYTFHPAGFGALVMEQLWPWESLKSHFQQISTTNPYPDGSLQAWIQGARGVIRMLGDLAAWVATIADIVAAIAAVCAVFTSETIIGGLTCGGIAAIAASVAVIAAEIKILLDVIDALLGIVQILILVDKIKKSKDPNERATLAAQLGRECLSRAARFVVDARGDRGRGRWEPARRGRARMSHRMPSAARRCSPSVPCACSSSCDSAVMDCESRSRARLTTQDLREDADAEATSSHGTSVSGPQYGTARNEPGGRSAMARIGNPRYIEVLKRICRLAVSQSRPKRSPGQRTFSSAPCPSLERDSPPPNSGGNDCHPRATASIAIGCRVSADDNGARGHDVEQASRRLHLVAAPAAARGLWPYRQANPSRGRGELRLRDWTVAGRPDDADTGPAYHGRDGGTAIAPDRERARDSTRRTCRRGRAPAAFEAELFAVTRYRRAAGTGRIQ